MAKPFQPFADEAEAGVRVSWTFDRVFLEQVETLPRVIAGEACGKCGAGDPHMKHHVQTVPMEGPGVVRVSEWLELRCVRCGYQWQRQPLDAKGVI